MCRAEQIKTRLMELCEQYDVFAETAPEVYGQVDLVDHSLVDSMTIVYLQSIISEHFSMEVPNEVFVLELRSIDAMAGYISEAVGEGEVCYE